VIEEMAWFRLERRKAEDLRLWK